MRKLLMFFILLIPLVGVGQESREYLKSRFETGKFPSQQDFSDLIDSYHHLDEDSYPLPDTVDVIATKYDLTQVEGGGGSFIWGQGTGTLSDQTDLTNALITRLTESQANDLYIPLSGSKSLLGSLNLTVPSSSQLSFFAGDSNLDFNNTGSEVSINCGDFVFSGHQLKFTPTSVVFENEFDAVLPAYAADYSSNYTDRTWTDKGYVDAGDAAAMEYIQQIDRRTNPLLYFILGFFAATIGYLIAANSNKFKYFEINKGGKLWQQMQEWPLGRCLIVGTKDPATGRKSQK